MLLLKMWGMGSLVLVLDVWVMGEGLKVLLAARPGDLTAVPADQGGI